MTSTSLKHEEVRLYTYEALSLGYGVELPRVV